MAVRRRPAARRTVRRGAAGFGGFCDIFDAFFGGSAAGAARRARPSQGSDLRYDLRISFEEAVLGAEKEIEFPVLGRCDTCAGSGAKAGSTPVQCPQCNGRGEVRSVRQTMLGQMVNVAACPRCRGEGKVVENPCDACRGEGRTERRRSLRVTIPAGIDEGHQIRLTNEGEVGPRGGAPGSLYVAIHVADHPSLTREGTELYYEADLSIAQAALGTKLRVPTVDGEDAEVEIKPGTQPGTEIKLRGRGVPHLRRQSVRGDLHVIANVSRSHEALQAPARAARGVREGDRRDGLRAAGCARSWACDGSGTGAPDPDGRGGPATRDRTGRSPGRWRTSTSRRAAATPGAWLELSVAADHEAVEAVSEILARAAPGGTSVEPAFELVEEGLAARVDLARPAMVRAHLPILDPAAVARRRRPGGAGARPPPGVRPAAHRRSRRLASSTRRTGRTPGRRTSRCCASGAGS